MTRIRGRRGGDPPGHYVPIPARRSGELSRLARLAQTAQEYGGLLSLTAGVLSLAGATALYFGIRLAPGLDARVGALETHARSIDSTLRAQSEHGTHEREVLLDSLVRVLAPVGALVRLRCAEVSRETAYKAQLPCEVTRETLRGR